MRKIESSSCAVFCAHCGYIYTKRMHAPLQQRQGIINSRISGQATTFLHFIVTTLQSQTMAEIAHCAHLSGRAMETWCHRARCVWMVHCLHWRHTRDPFVSVEPWDSLLYTCNTRGCLHFQSCHWSASEKISEVLSDPRAPIFGEGNQQNNLQDTRVYPPSFLHSIPSLIRIHPLFRFLHSFRVISYGTSSSPPCRFRIL